MDKSSITVPVEVIYIIFRSKLKKSDLKTILLSLCLFCNDQKFNMDVVIKSLEKLGLSEDANKVMVEINNYLKEN